MYAWCWARLWCEMKTECAKAVMSGLTCVLPPACTFAKLQVALIWEGLLRVNLCNRVEGLSVQVLFLLHWVVLCDVRRILSQSFSLKWKTRPSGECLNGNPVNQKHGTQLLSSVCVFFLNCLGQRSKQNYIPERVSFIILPGLNFSVGVSLQNAVTMLPNPSCLDLNLKPSLPTNCSVGSDLSCRLWPFSTF